MHHVGLTDYSDYIAYNLAYIYVECRYRIDMRLMPHGTVLGVIDRNSEDILFKGILDEYPNIIKMDSCSLKTNMFSLYIRLSQKSSSEIMPTF